MLKKLTALFLSLLLSLSLLPERALAAVLPASGESQVLAEAQDSPNPDELEYPVMLTAAEEAPDEEDSGHADE